jgi:CDP-paratose 2-epimerase
MKRKILITGGAGFIGSNLSDWFASRGHLVTVLDNLSRPGSSFNLAWLRERHRNLRFIRADIRRDHGLLRKAVQGQDAIFHLAGQVAVTTSVKSPREDFEINVVGTLNLLEIVRTSDVRPVIIFSSTNKVYGGMEHVRISLKNGRYMYDDFPHGIPETQLLDFHSPYGCSKGAADQYMRDYARIYGLHTIVFRQSAIYGPRQFGMEDQGWLAWFVIATAMHRPITIYGDGHQVRDMLYIDDLAQAFEIAMERGERLRGEVFNIGGGPQNTLSLLESLSLLEEYYHRPIRPRFAEWRPGDQPCYISDIRKAREQLQWQPRISTQKGVPRLIEWVEAHKKILARVIPSPKLQKT